jgi:hypothetical protein
MSYVGEIIRDHIDDNGDNSPVIPAHMLAYSTDLDSFIPRILVITGWDKLTFPSSYEDFFLFHNSLL